MTSFSGDLFRSESHYQYLRMIFIFFLLFVTILQPVSVKMMIIISPSIINENSSRTFTETSSERGNNEEHEYSDNSGINSKIHLSNNISLSGVTNNSILNKNVSPYINLEIMDINLAQAWYQWDSDSNIVLTSPFRVAIMGEGYRKLSITTIDYYGINTTVNFFFYILKLNANTIIVQQSVNPTFESESFNITVFVFNLELIPLALTLVFFSNDTLLFGNSSDFNLSPGSNQNISVGIKPLHTSIHDLDLVLLHEGEIYIELTHSFEVRPFIESPRFWQSILNIIIIPVSLIVIIILVVLGRRVHMRFNRMKGAFPSQTTPLSNRTFTQEKQGVNIVQVDFRSVFTQIFLVFFADEGPLILDYHSRIPFDHDKIDILQTKILARTTASYQPSEELFGHLYGPDVFFTRGRAIWFNWKVRNPFSHDPRVSKEKGARTTIFCVYETKFDQVIKKSERVIEDILIQFISEMTDVTEIIKQILQNPGEEISELEYLNFLETRGSGQLTRQLDVLLSDHISRNWKDTKNSM
ncbi:MAG: hypothetical protein ACW991_04065 [Candidatus Hodarchaeales archaeon]